MTFVSPKFCKLSTWVSSESRQWPSWPTGSSDLDLQAQCFYLASTLPCWTFNSTALWCHHPGLSHPEILSSIVLPFHLCLHFHGGVQILDSFMFTHSIFPSSFNPDPRVIIWTSSFINILRSIYTHLHLLSSCFVEWNTSLPFRFNLCPTLFLWGPALSIISFLLCICTLCPVSYEHAQLSPFSILPLSLHPYLHLCPNLLPPLLWISRKRVSIYLSFYFLPLSPPKFGFSSQRI